MRALRESFLEFVTRNNFVFLKKIVEKFQADIIKEKLSSF